MHKLLYVSMFVFMAGFVWSQTENTPAQQCQDQHFEGLKERIQIKPCGKDRCKLTKEQNTTVVFRFKPTKDVKTLENNVYAVIGIPLPFLGVHGTNACNNVVNAADGTRATCPLKAGQEYEYTNVFYIHPFYPETNLKVHWSLDDGKKQVICFEVPAVIARNKKKPLIV